MDCVFCKIVAKEEPSYTVYEDDETIAFLDRYPISQGHTLVLLKAHYNRFRDLPADALAKLFAIVQQLNILIQRNLPADASNIAINDGKEANQIIPHVHVHIIPRKANDEVTFRHRLRVNSLQLETVRDRIACNVKG